MIYLEEVKLDNALALAEGLCLLWAVGEMLEEAWVVAQKVQVGKVRRAELWATPVWTEAAVAVAHQILLPMIVFELLREEEIQQFFWACLPFLSHSVSTPRSTCASFLRNGHPDMHSECHGRRPCK